MNEKTIASRDTASLSIDTLLGEHGGGSLPGTLRDFFDKHIWVTSFWNLRML